MLHQKKEINISEIILISQSLIEDAAYNIDLIFLISNVIEKNEDIKKLGRVVVTSTSKIYKFDNGNIITDFAIAMEV